MSLPQRLVWKERSKLHVTKKIKGGFDRIKMVKGPDNPIEWSFSMY